MKKYTLNEVEQLKMLSKSIVQIEESFSPMGGDQRNMQSDDVDSSEIEMIAQIDEWCMDNSNNSSASKWLMQAEQELDRAGVSDWAALENEEPYAIANLIQLATDLGIAK